MLLGSNSRDVIYAVKDRVAEIQRTLPPSVVIETVYDRADFVERTLSTVMTNLIEGAWSSFLCWSYSSAACVAHWCAWSGSRPL